MTAQFIRKISLVVSNGKANLDLSAFRIKFHVRQSDVQSPNNTQITIYNLADTTAQKIQQEYTQVTLQAGYESGPYGQIFNGSVRQVFRGKNNVASIRVNRETPTETYLDIFAGEGDDPYCTSTINTTLAAGATDNDVVQALNQALGTQLAPLPFQFGGNPQPRGQVLYGMSRDHLRTLTVPNGMRWSIQKGKLVLISNTAYLEGQVVTLNSQTGMIGMPEQTDEGIKITALLNPNIAIGTTVKINNADLVKAAFSPGYTDLNYPPPTSADGTYRVLVSEFEGDSRGDPWYSHLVCLSVDPSAPIQSAVPGYPGGNGAGTAASGN